jgi:Flp pilus assembly protein TadG
MTKRMGAEAGQELVEYALVLPLFLLLVLSIFEFGILFFQYNTVANAAREGARAGAMVATEGCDDACIAGRVENAAERLTTGLTPEDLTINVSFPSQAGSNYVRVEVKYATGYLTKMLVQATGGADALTLSSVSTMMRE